MITHALVRPPAANFADGLTTVDLGAPDVPRALHQHAKYCEALADCGVSLVPLPPDSRFPDATFVEDTAVIIPPGVVFTRPGATARAGEVAASRAAMATRLPTLGEIVTPGTLDGGDVCMAGTRVFIGLSRRTNEEGARQLAALMAPHAFTCTTIDIRGLPSILHLKSGLVALDAERVVAVAALASRDALQGLDILCAPAGEEYAANCVRVNSHVLVAAGFPGLHDMLARRGLRPIAVEMSEYRRMDGGLSCLSLRWRHPG